MSIKRSPRPESCFYILNKSISEDKKLSWGARGMLVYLLGKPDNWTVSLKQLENETKDSGKHSGRDAVRALVSELITVGYLKVEQSRTESGHFDKANYTVYETPCTENPSTDKPCTANPQLISNEDKQGLISTNKKINKKSVQTKADQHNDQSQASTSEKQKAFDPKSVELPLNVNQENWNDFVDMRTSIRKPLSERAVQLLLKKLVSFGATANQSLEASIIGSYLSVFQVKSEQPQQQAQQPLRRRFGGNNQNNEGAMRTVGGQNS